MTVHNILLLDLYATILYAKLVFSIFILKYICEKYVNTEIYHAELARNTKMLLGENSTVSIWYPGIKIDDILLKHNQILTKFGI